MKHAINFGTYADIIGQISALNPSVDELDMGRLNLHTFSTTQIVDMINAIPEQIKILDLGSYGSNRLYEKSTAELAQIYSAVGRKNLDQCILQHTGMTINPPGMRRFKTTEELVQLISRWPETLKIFDLSYNEFYRRTPEDFEAIFSVKPAQATILNLGANGFEHEPADKVAAIMATIPSAFNTLIYRFWSSIPSFRKNYPAEEFKTVLAAIPQSVTTLDLEFSDIHNLSSEYLSQLEEGLPYITTFCTCLNEIDQMSKAQLDALAKIMPHVQKVIAKDYSGNIVTSENLNYLESKFGMQEPLAVTPENKLVGTFFDVVALEDIDINHPNAKFYLINVANEDGSNPGFKLCATVQNLSQLQFDPESRKKQYWPITREQLEKAGQDVLFEKAEVSGGDEIFKFRRLVFKTPGQINNVFRFNPPFDPRKTATRRFGQPEQQQNQPRLIQEQQQLRRQMEQSRLRSRGPEQQTSIFRSTMHTMRQIPINPDIRDLINQGFITEAQYTNVFTQEERMNVVHAHQLIAKHLLTVEAAKQLTNPQAEILEKRQIITLIEQEKLSIDAAKALSGDQITRLKFAQPLISAGVLTVLSALQLQLNDRQVATLPNPGMIALIQEGHLTFQQMLALNNNDAFNYDRTQPLISAHKLTFDEAKELSFDEVQTLKTPVIRDLILNDQLTINQAKHLNHEQIESIEAGRVEEVLRQLPPDAPESPSPQL